MMAKLNKRLVSFRVFSCTVAYWCMHGDPDNLESLHNKREQELPQGHPWIYSNVAGDGWQGPQELGYAWSMDGRD